MATATNPAIQGKYSVEADVYTVNDEPVTCLKATVVFGRRDLSDYLDL